MSAGPTDERRQEPDADFGWWWADPLAALGVVYVATREGIENWSANERDGPLPSPS